MSDVKVPGLGNVSKPTAVAVGGGVVLLAGIAWYRARKTAAAASTSPTDTAAPTDDPATGYPAGSAADTAALAAQASGAMTGGYYTQPGYQTPPPSQPGYTTNGAWSQAAEEYLVNTVGLHADVVGNALGKYITGQALSTDQVALVEQAIAFVGYPPVNGPTGHPPAYVTATTPPPPGGGSGSGGGSGTPGSKLSAPTHLHTTSVGRTSVTLAWSGVPHAIGYRIWQKPFGADVGEASGTTGVVHNLRPGTRYTWHVTALGSDGRDGPSSHTITVTTKK